MKQFFLVSIVCLSIASVAQTKSAPEWGRWEKLIGTWRGEGDGQPGQGAGVSSFQFDLQKRIITRKSHSEYPGTDGKPGIVHDDLMFIYFDTAGQPVKAIYFDNEGHTINYDAAFPDDRSIVLTSDLSVRAPRFRLSYRLENENTITVSFAIAPPGKPDAFAPYVVGKMVRTAP